MAEGMHSVIKIAAAGILFSVLEYLIPAGNIHRSAAAALRMIVLLAVSDILLAWLR